MLRVQKMYEEAQRLEMEQMQALPPPDIYPTYDALNQELKRIYLNKLFEMELAGIEL